MWMSVFRTNLQQPNPMRFDSWQTDWSQMRLTHISHVCPIKTHKFFNIISQASYWCLYWCFSRCQPCSVVRRLSAPLLIWVFVSYWISQVVVWAKCDSAFDMRRFALGSLDNSCVLALIWLGEFRVIAFLSSWESEWFDMIKYFSCVLNVIGRVSVSWQQFDSQIIILFFMSRVFYLNFILL